jgi:hypothetical protein
MAAPGDSIRLTISALGARPGEHRSLLARMLEHALAGQPAARKASGGGPQTPCDTDPACALLEEYQEPDGTVWRIYLCDGTTVSYRL